jgi:hypothetical protein
MDHRDAKEDAMRVLRENIVPVAFLALWVAVSGYTLHTLGGLHGPGVIEATMDLTVTAPLHSTAHAICPEMADSLTREI